MTATGRDKLTKADAKPSETDESKDTEATAPEKAEATEKPTAKVKAVVKPKVKTASKPKVVKPKEVIVDAQSDDENEEAEQIDPIYFVNSKTLNLNTSVGNFERGLFIAETKEQAQVIRKTEDFQRGFIEELSEKEYKATQKKSEE